MVTLTSSGHRAGRIRVDDPNFTTGRYRRYEAYTQSKLANILVTLDLARRLPGHSQRKPYLVPSDTAAKGALPTLRAAVDLQARNGQFYARCFVFIGRPVPATPSAQARDAELGRRLWDSRREPPRSGVRNWSTSTSPYSVAPVRQRRA